MSKLWYRTRNDDGKSQLHEVDLSAFRIDAPTVIYLSGFLTTNNQPGFIAGALKRLEELLTHRAPVDDVPVKLYSWSHSSLANLFNMAAYNGFPNSKSSDAGHTFAAGVILPLVCADFARDDKGRASGSPLPAEDAKRNLRNITLLTYSAGTVTAQEIFNASLKMMKQCGYAEGLAREVLREVVLVSTGNVSRPSKEKDRFTTVYLVATNDIVVRGKNALWAPFRTLASKTFAVHRDELQAERLCQTSLFVTARLNKEEWEWRKNRDVKWLDKINPLLPAWTMVNSNHELPYYITHDEQLSPFANIALYTLTNAIQRDATPDVYALIQPPKGAEPDEAAFYKDKIKKACVKPRR